MSRTKHFAAGAIAALGLSLVVGCASQPETEQAALWTPASAELRAAADRAPPLNRVAFWSDEYEKTPEDLDTALSFLDALMAIKSTERAAEVAARTAVVHPDSPELLTVWGRALSREARYDDAVSVLTRASDLDPSNVTAFAGLGAALDHIGQHDRAQAAYRRALAIEPERVSTLSNLGLSLMLTGDLEGAADYLEQAAALPGANAKVRQNLALVLGLQGQVEEARQVASLDAPAELVDKNLEILQSLRAPVRDWGALDDEDTSPVDDAGEEGGEPANSDTPLRGSLTSGR